MTLAVLLLVVAFVLFAIATVHSPARVNLIAAGLALVVLAKLLGEHHIGVS